MTNSCQHCGTHYSEPDGVDGFCCAGCAQVYQLIREGGFDGYYALQDRVGKPLGAQPFEVRDAAWARGLQAEAEAGDALPQLTLSVSGLSCMGCVWLVERLGRRMAGVRSIRVNLERQTVSISWIRGKFSLPDLVREWQRFGYRAEPIRASSGRQLSPLAWRVLLCGLFAINGLLLAAPERFDMLALDYSELFRLFALLCVFLSFSVGASFFILPVYQAFRLKNLHYDALPALGLFLLFIGSIFGSFFSGITYLPLWLFPLLVFVALSGRWVQRLLWENYEPMAQAIEAWVLTYIRMYSIGVFLLVILSGALLGIEAALAGLLASSLYPTARSVSAAPSRWIIGAGLFISMMGVALALSGILGIFGAVLWMGLSGLVWSVLFFCLKRFYSKCDA
jgi:Cu2+-exporting ATPase